MGRPKKEVKSSLNEADLAVIAAVVKQVLKDSLVSNASGALEPVVEEQSPDIEQPKKKVKPTKKKGGKLPQRRACRAEPFVPKKRPNNFLKMPEFNQFKQDSEVDKKLWGKNKPIARKSASLVTVQCVECQEEYEVSPQLISDVEHYVCDNCVPR